MVHLKLHANVTMYSESFYGNWQIQNVITMGKDIVMLITIFTSDVISLYYISIIFQKTLREKLIVQNYYSYIVTYFYTVCFFSRAILVVNKKIKNKK